MNLKNKAILICMMWLSLMTTLSAVSIPFYTDPNVQTVVRLAGLDIGSSSFKLLVADYNLETGKMKIIFSTAVKVPLGSDLTMNNNRKLSDNVIQQALEAITLLKGEAEKWGSSEIRGIVTAALRTAENGPEVLEKFNRVLQPIVIEGKSQPLRIVSQALEGKIGFNAVIAIYPEVEPEHIVAADFGSMSIQFTTMTLEGLKVFEIPLGSNTFLKVFAEKIRGENYVTGFDPNPILIPEVALFQEELKPLIPDVPLWLQEKLAHPKTVVVGLADFAVIPRALKQEICSIDDVGLLPFNYCNTLSADEKMKAISIYPHTIVIRLVAIHAFMEKFKIRTISYREMVGSAPGIINTRELWID